MGGGAERIRTADRSVANCVLRRLGTAPPVRAIEKSSFTKEMDNWPWEDALERYDTGTWRLAENFSMDFDVLLKPIFDMIWSAFVTLEVRVTAMTLKRITRGR